MIRVSYEHIDIQVALTLVSFLRQNVPRMRMAALDLAGRRKPESLGGAFVGFKFWHWLTFHFVLLYLVLGSLYFGLRTKHQALSTSSVEWAPQPSHSYVSSARG